MKQHITVTQLSKLTKSQKKVLDDYQNKGISDDFRWEIHPLEVDIGFMIEYLNEKMKDDWSIHFGKNLAFAAQASKDGFYGKTPENKKGELCDGLWELVKEYLKE